LQIDAGVGRRLPVEVWRDLGVNLFRMFQSWQGPERLPRSALGQPDFVKTLQVQPEFPHSCQKMSEMQSRVPGNGTLPIQDFGDPVGWDAQLPREFSRTHF